MIPKRIGIVGGGQLGRMMAFEAHRMGFRVTVLDPTPESPAGQAADEQIVAGYGDQHAISELAAKSDVITYEIELDDSGIFDRLVAGGTLIHPSVAAFKRINDKYLQKVFLRKAGIPVADFFPVRDKADVFATLNRVGYPVLLKTRRFAYDGRGNALIKRESDIDAALPTLQGAGLYVEKFVPFVKELAVMAARGERGNVVTYPVVETIHKHNICHIVKAPAEVTKAVAAKARRVAGKVMTSLNATGVFGVEMFLTKHGDILVNEIAPRVHNSGHYTIEACVTNQFAQHIRAITGLPLGSTDMVVPAAVMVNILGDRKGVAVRNGLHKALSVSGVAVHLYGKKETRRERKMGHITAVGATPQEAYAKAMKARKVMTV